MRENHGFDIGFGFMGIPRIVGGVNESRGVGAGWAVDAAMAIVMVNPEISYYFNQTVGKTIHELTHLFSGVHLNSPFPCIMDSQGTHGDHTGNGTLRMSYLTEGTLSLPYNLLQFAGAARPMTISSLKYGQWGCHTFFMFTSPTSPVQYMDNSGGPNEYFWEYTGWYDYFNVANQRSMVNITADNNDVNESYYYVGYKLYFNSTFWPTGFDPSSTTLKTNFRFKISAVADDIQYRHAYVRLLDDDCINPSTMGTWSYDFTNNGDIEKHTELSSSFTDTDTTVWLLFGLEDDTSDDYHQQVYTWIKWMDLLYEYGYTP